MRELLLGSALAVLLALFAGCSGGAKRIKGEAPTSGSAPTQAKEKPAAPGMIPDECESLLNKSQEWKFIPGQKWKPGSVAEILAVAKFFSSFRLVPEGTSETIRELERSDANMPAEARALLKKYSKKQVCDIFLAQTFLQAIVDYRWNKADKAEAGNLLHRFLVNQQAIELPLLHRSLEAQIFVRALKKGLVPGAAPKARELEKWMERAIAHAPAPRENATSLQEWEQFKAELDLSEKIRDRVGSVIPLP